MSYKTNARALRLGLAHDWVYKAHGPIGDFHLDHKIVQYLGNLVQYVVSQAPQRSKTKGKYLRKFSVEPGIQGKSRVLRSQEHIYAFIYFYLNYDGASPRQMNRLIGSFEAARRTLKAETRCDVHLLMLNYFMFFWRYELFLGRRFSRRVKSKVQRCVLAHEHLREERAVYKNVAQKTVRFIRKGVRRWRREQYFKRTLYPMVSGFLFRDFDAEIVTRSVAMELQILRIYHRRFLRYVQRLIQLSIRHTQAEHRWLEGLELRIKGRLTSFRRQERRSGIKTMRFASGRMKKSDLRREASHCAFIAYNRYGVISVQMTYQRRSQEFRHWSGESMLRPEVFFGGEALLDVLRSDADSGDFTGELRQRTPLLPPRSARYGYQQRIQREAFAPCEDQPLTTKPYLTGERFDYGPFEKALARAGQGRQPSLRALMLQFQRRHRQRLASHPGMHAMHPYSLPRDQRHRYTQEFRNRGMIYPFLWEQHTFGEYLRRCRPLDARHRGPAMAPLTVRARR